MSRALFRSSSSSNKKGASLFYRKVIGNKKSIEIWITTCIVTNSENASVLINPSNPDLSGVSNFPYFPRGGPVPNKVDSMHKDWQPLGFVSQWGGMEVGSGMLYPIQVVDGLVHQLGGLQLQAECRLKKTMSFGSDACPIGKAVMTSAGNDKLRETYDYVVHTTPPFFKYDEEPHKLLQSCYREALSLSFSLPKCSRVATPLLGAGARGFPVKDAIKIAAVSVQEWYQEEEVSSSTDNEQNVAFGLQELDYAERLKKLLEEDDNNGTNIAL